jgi:hypothetical protein
MSDERRDLDADFADEEDRVSIAIASHFLGEVVDS